MTSPADYRAEVEGLQHVASVPSLSELGAGRVFGASGEIVYVGPEPLLWAVQNMPPGVVTFNGTHTLGRVSKDKPLPKRVIQGVNGAAIEPPRVYLEGGGWVYAQDAVAFDQEQRDAVVFRDLTIRCGTRSGVVTYDDGSDERMFRLDFDNVITDGGYDHAAGVGHDSKWGWIMHRRAGYAHHCTFRNVKQEHGDYEHTPEGDLWFTQCLFTRNGRCGLQVVGRVTESGHGDHRVTVADCRFVDNGLGAGGANLTIQGARQWAVRRTRVTIGQDEVFAQAWLTLHPDKKFGTTAFVNWPEWQDIDGDGDLDARNMITEDGWFDDFAAVAFHGHGNGDLVQVTNTERLSLTGRIVMDSGTKWSEPLVVNSSAIKFIALKELQLIGGAG